MTNVVLVGSSEETRLLLRGLLRLYRHRVMADGPTLESVAPSLDTRDPLTVIAEVEGDAAPALEPVGQLLRDRPQIRFFLLTSRKDEAFEEAARRLGVVGFLRRPFAVHTLIDAVEGPRTATPVASISPRQR